jgi:hypothetical protein
VFHKRDDYGRRKRLRGRLRRSRQYHVGERHGGHCGKYVGQRPRARWWVLVVPLAVRPRKVPGRAVLVVAAALVVVQPDQARPFRAALMAAPAVSLLPIHHLAAALTTGGS